MSRWVLWGTLAVSALACGWACNASDGSSQLGSGGSAHNGTMGNGGGGFGQSGGSGGVDECVGIDETAQPALQPADIVFAIDTSGSMGEESTFVKDKMNAFSQQIIASGIDVRVVMLALQQPSFPP